MDGTRNFTLLGDAGWRRKTLRLYDVAALLGMTYHDPSRWRLFGRLLVRRGPLGYNQPARIEVDSRRDCRVEPTERIMDGRNHDGYARG